MKIVFFALLFAAICLYFFSAKKYAGFIEPLDEKAYPLKRLIPLGLYIMDICRYKYSTGYDRGLLTKIAEISGVKHSQYYLRIHWANKIVLLFIALLISTLVGASFGTDAVFWIFNLSLIILVLYLTDNELNERIKKRRIAIRIDFPDFLNKLTLLINAGMTVSRAWEKVVMDDKKGGALYEELRATLSDIRAGKPEQQAYEDFAKRCKTPEITRSVSVILQNLRKGNSEIVSILRVQANDCREMRKNTAKRLGEEASTKLLLPMMLMFLAVLLIVGAPAVLAIRGM